MAACKAGYSVAYYRLHQLVDMLAVFSPTDQKPRQDAETDQRRCPYHRRLYDHQHQPARAEDLTKIIFDRDGRLPTLISSQSAAPTGLKHCQTESEPIHS
uniref:hypothetical protein n=1 Tax=Corynebacterium striatum TaxID=43770 RepID=UPI0035A5EE2A